MKAALLAPVFLLAASAADARFAPRLGIDYRLASTATSERGAERNTFALVRSIRFERRPAGFVATVTVRSIDVTGEPSVAAQFARAYTALKDVPVLIDLDPAGAIGTVHDAALLWDRLRAGMMTGDPAAARIAAIFDAIPPAQRVTELASALAVSLALADADRTAGTRTTSISARAFGGRDGDVPAQETVTVSHGRTTIDLAADGSNPAGASVRLERHRVVDRRSGLSLERREDVTTSMLIDGAAHVTRMLTNHVLTAPVS